MYFKHILMNYLFLQSKINKKIKYQIHKTLYDWQLCCLKSLRFIFIHPPNPTLFVNGQLLSNTSSLKLLGVVFDQKSSFEIHIRSTVSNFAQNVWILWSVDPSIVRHCFYTLIHPVFVEWAEWNSIMTLLFRHSKILCLNKLLS